ncbi:FtsL-like putative cell division protein [Hymenobacter metallicola]|uniref:FtsL-like putative cell division protein n=1 Tax=Hymenobacter metallicola TaxID=2563114 RepID=UPI0019817511|nr:FtsL-like putative cell division protein [Hymenobacter metallicola]
MAINTLKPVANTPRANVPREVTPPPQATPEPAPLPEAEPAPKPKPPKREKPAPRSSWSVFSLLDRLTSVDSIFREGLPVQFLPHVLFIMFLILVYIGNTHWGYRMNRSIQKLKLETEDLRADYTTLKSDYMEASKQSEVARKVAAYGLVESSSPPFRITVPAGRLDEAELEAMPVLTADSLAALSAADSTALADSVEAAAEHPTTKKTTNSSPQGHERKR